MTGCGQKEQQAAAGGAKPGAMPPIPVGVVTVQTQSVPVMAELPFEAAPTVIEHAPPPPVAAEAAPVVATRPIVPAVPPLPLTLPADSGPAAIQDLSQAVAALPARPIDPAPPR